MRRCSARNLFERGEHACQSCLYSLGDWLNGVVSAQPHRRDRVQHFNDAVSWLIGLTDDHVAGSSSPMSRSARSAESWKRLAIIQLNYYTIM